MILLHCVIVQCASFLNIALIVVHFAEDSNIFSGKSGYIFKVDQHKHQEHLRCSCVSSSLNLKESVARASLHCGLKRGCTTCNTKYYKCLCTGGVALMPCTCAGRAG